MTPSSIFELCWRARDDPATTATLGPRTESAESPLTQAWMGDSTYVAPSVVREIRAHGAPWDVRTLTVVLDGKQTMTLDLWAAKKIMDKRAKKIMDAFAFLLRFVFGVVRRARPQALTDRPHVHIHVVACAARRVLPNASPMGVVGVDHVNGGFAFSSAGQHHVVVYRMEDMFKVTLHELIHAYGLDFRAYDAGWDRRFARALARQRGLSTTAAGTTFDPKMFEAYTEAVACVLHICAFAIYSCPRGKPSSSTRYARLCASLWEQESAHYQSRCDAIVRYMRRAHAGRYVEGSHVFSYYFVKASLFDPRNRQDFLAFLPVFVCFRRSAAHAFLKLVATCMDRAPPTPTPTKTPTKTPRSLSMTSIKTGRWLQ